MSTTQHPRQRSDRARVAYLADQLDQWEANLRAGYDESRPDGRTHTFDEARRWKLDAELDMIAEVREIIGRADS